MIDIHKALIKINRRDRLKKKAVRKRQFKRILKWYKRNSKIWQEMEESIWQVL